MVVLVVLGRGLGAWKDKGFRGSSFQEFRKFGFWSSWFQVERLSALGNRFWSVGFGGLGLQGSRLQGLGLWVCCGFALQQVFLKLKVLMDGKEEYGSVFVGGRVDYGRNWVPEGCCEGSKTTVIFTA